jgi:hypothetical protein
MADNSVVTSFSQSLGPNRIKAWLDLQPPSRAQSVLARLHSQRQSSALAFLGGLGSLVELVPPQTQYSSESAVVVLGYGVNDDLADDWVNLGRDFASVLLALPGRTAAPQRETAHGV